MGRLIDADDAINVFTNRLFETLKTNLPCVTAEENQICLETCYKIAKYEIDTIPTAYNVDAVVEDLQKVSTIIEQNENSIKCAIEENMAVHIVKRGGVE